jgi:hypothetical protein
MLPLPLQADEEKKSEPPWYEVEVIVFERIAPGAGSTESWPANPGAPSRLNAIPLKWSGDSGAAEPIAYSQIPRSERRISKHFQRLRNSRNYRPHLHLAWRQQMVSPDKAQQIFFQLPKPQEGQPQAEIEGVIKIGVKRYLHLYTDILLRRTEIRNSGEGEQDMLPLGSGYRDYRLQTHRRMRSGVLHYLDHPVIGVLVLVSKYQAPKPPPPSEAPVSPPEPEPRPEPTPAPAQSQESSPAAKESE